MTPFLAVDWGSSNLRAWAVDEEGRVRAERRAPSGVRTLKPGEARERLAAIRAELDAEELPALLCGSIGSTIGWRTTPDVPCPAAAEDVAGVLTLVEDAPALTFIAPGVQGVGLDGAPDVMRGEETQVFGWLAAQPDAQRGRWLVCHPGTHGKWIVVDGGRIVRFVTFMTGELLDVLRRHSVLAGPEPAADDAAFDEGVRMAGGGDALAARLFTARSRVVQGGADPATTGSYLSGVLVGAEVASALARFTPAEAERLVLMGAPALTSAYGRVLSQRDRPFQRVSGEEAALAGLKLIFELGFDRDSR